jgi:hypothetical protein
MMPNWRSSPGSKAGTTPNAFIAALGMRSPDEYEAAFYADTTNLDTTVKVGNPELSLQ